MKLLFFYQHFWPDSPPYATILRVIGEHLAAGGMQVSVLAAQPSYKSGDRQRTVAARETLGGVAVQRLPHLPFARRSAAVMKLGRALFPLRACLRLVGHRLLGRRHDVIVAATIPPVANGFFGLLAARLTGARFVYHFQDIYPEIGAAGALWRADSWTHRLLLAVDTFTTRHADRAVVLSADMRDALVSRGVDAARIIEINNFMLTDFAAPPTPAASDAASDAATDPAAAQASPTPGAVAVDGPPPGSEPTAAAGLQGAGDGRFQVVFAGNLGRFQGLDAVLDAFLALDPDQVRLDLHFLGEGVMLETLQARAASSEHVHFHGHQPFATASRLIAGCDAGIVTIAEGIYRYAYPSKTLTYLGLGVPVLAVVEQESALARTIAGRELGVVAHGRDVQGLQQAFAALVDYLQAGKGDAERICTAFEHEFGTPVILRQWEQAIAQTLRQPERILET